MCKIYFSRCKFKYIEVGYVYSQIVRYINLMAILKIDYYYYKCI